ncbi:hypothetical protein M0Q50_05985 [bacterium]|jgi:hypothetical protein|nr:hypothetical protein [bacterium]
MKINLNKEIKPFYGISSYIASSKIIFSKKDIKALTDACDEFGLDYNKVENIGIVESNKFTNNLEDIMSELDKKQIEYYQFDMPNGDEKIFVDLTNLIYND